MQEFTLHQARRNHGWNNSEELHGFATFLFLFFVVFGLVRLSMTGTPQEVIAEQNAILLQRDNLVAQYHARIQEEKTLMQELGAQYSYDEAYQLRYDLYPLFDSLSRIRVLSSLEAIGPFMEKANANMLAALNSGGTDYGAKHRAFQQYGVHPMEARGKIDASIFWKIPKGLFMHVVFCAMFMPFFLLGRMMYRTRCSGRALAKALGPHLWWLVVCSILWPFMGSLHVEREPKETTRFFFLRFVYMLRAKKLFITVAEKNALLREAGTADEAIDTVVARVREAAELATGAQRRLAMVSFLLAFFTFSGFQMLQPSVAQATEITQQAEPEEQEPTFSYTGYGVMELHSSEAGEEMRFKYLRVKPVYKNGRWSLTSEVDVNGTTKAKTAYVGYDYPELALRIDAGRIASPYAWNYIPPNKDVFNRTPLDDDLGVPFFDNGIIASVDFGSRLNLKAAATNGSGDYSDDNSEMDLSARLSANTPFGTFSATYQGGQQPAGTRELYALCYELNLDPIAFRMLGVERPDIDGTGFMVSAVTRAGPNWSFSAQYDETNVKGLTNRYCDFGANLCAGEKTTLKFRVLASDPQKPEYSFRIVQLF